MAAIAVAVYFGVLNKDKGNVSMNPTTSGETTTNNQSAINPSKMHSNLIEYKTDQGMDVVTYVSNKVPLVTLVLTVKAGAMTETPETNGLTHLWEHMFFKGNKRLPTQEDFKKRIRQLGISYNGDTSAEKVRYYFTMPSAFFEEGMQFMADAIATPLLNQEELDKEINVVLNEYERFASRPQFDMRNVIRHHIYGDLEHKRDPLGLRKTIKSTTREILFQIKDEVMVPANSALIIAGDVEESKVKEYVDKYFAEWKNPKDWKAPVKAKFQPFPETLSIITTAKHLPTPSVSIQFNGPLVSDDPKATFAADIFAGLIDHSNSKFTKKFIDSGIAFSASGGYYTQNGAGEMSLYASAKPENILKVRDMLLAEIEEWKNPDYFPEAHLEDVRRQLKISHLKSVNSPSSYAKTLGFWWAVTGLDYYRNYIPQLLDVTRDDVVDFVKTWMVDKPYVSAVALSPENAKEAGIEPNSKELEDKYLIEYRKDD